MAFLKVFAPEGERTVFLGEGRVVIGRGDDTDVMLADRKASRHHCAIEAAGPGRWRVIDLGSGNGTKLNGEGVGEALLRPNDVLIVGDTRILFQGEAVALVADELAAARKPPRTRFPWAPVIAGGSLLLAFLVYEFTRPKRAAVILPRPEAAQQEPGGERYDPAREIEGLAPDAALVRLRQLLESEPEGRRGAIRAEIARQELARRETSFRGFEQIFRDHVARAEYARAREIWFFLRGDAEWAEVPQAYQQRIIDAMESLETAARAERGRLLEDVTLAENAHDFVRAREILEGALPRFLGTAAARSMQERLDFVEKAIRHGVTGGPAIAPTAVGVDLAQKVAVCLARLSARDFAGAAEGLVALKGEAKEARARAEIAMRARECAAAAALRSAAASELAAGQVPAQPLARVWRVLGGDDRAVRVRHKEEEREIAWADLAPELLLALLERQVEKAPDGALGLAVAAHAAGSREQLVAALARSYAVEAQRPLIDAFVSARVLNLPLPEGGYVVDAGEIVTRKEYLRRKEEAAIAAFQAQLDKSLAKIRENGVLAKVAKFKERKDKLDQVRDYALSLIFDEKAYFYPYRGVGRDAEYARVQEEVDHRVDAVRELWEDRATLLVKSTSDLDRELKSFDQAAAELERRLVDVREKVDEVAWLRGYLGVKFDIRNFWRTPDERDLILYSQEVMEDNEKVKGDITEVEREQVAVTNEYRMMFGRQAVRLMVPLVLSSRGHCEEMSRLGYFGHFSTTPGRETPFDRMKLQGYEYGASENCIMGQTNPMGAHVGWCHSSGHHRNILMAPWTEMGTGHYGIYMTQNYGQAPRHSRRDPVFTPVEGGGEGGAGEAGGATPGAGFNYEDEASGGK